ncbi:hypothetical protein GCM10008933_19830 [Paenibacillus motobuensis]|uniref:Uncharacterized protein n=1 Tax=Paenibacillus motobuensis TaxID=295324 RepID=A0ABN0YAC2_9BACL
MDLETVTERRIEIKPESYNERQKKNISKVQGSDSRELSHVQSGGVFYAVAIVTEKSAQMTKFEPYLFRKLENAFRSINV